ncbi:unnamed protein product [Plutella xylostella]|uniref:(diamondback moth) hypothetical protein n=1 Tax=Plutella xylostella TaxID=51655 RepID=A0A8S4FYC6_PLUXY|nr:unnamed protein product [Plutella xylostella]
MLSGGRLQATSVAGAGIREAANGLVIPDELKHGAGVKRTEDPPTIDDMLWCKVEDEDTLGRYCATCHVGLFIDSTGGCDVSHVFVFTTSEHLHYNPSKLRVFISRRSSNSPSSSPDGGAAVVRRYHEERLHLTVSRFSAQSHHHPERGLQKQAVTTDLETLSEVPDEAFGEREQFEQLYYQLVAEARSLLKRSSLPALPPPAEEGSEAGSSAPHAMVKVTARDGSLRTARVLLDNGSTTNYVTQDLFSKLELDGRHVSSTVTGINGQTSFASECCDLVIESHSDSSERAYGACVYVRTVDREGQVCVRLLTSKNKISPLKAATIPRLELCGALLGTRLASKVQSSLTIPINNCFYWCDSTIVLAWLSTSPSVLKQFVRNRVGEIQDVTCNQQWSYVPSKQNPADLVSRGVGADQLNVSSLWWSGPEFLQHKEIQYPQIPNLQQNSLPEISLHTQNKNNDKTQNIISILIHKLSSFNKLILKAVHLELVTDLSKEAFLAALARFTARRGKPRCIHADNSTTFVGGFNELNSFLSNNSDAIQSSMNEQGIDFKFIPPYSPHFGGLWESAVKSVKHHLRRTLGLAHLTYEEMTTCLIQIEAILNSRPLVPISSDPSDLSCLTPAHFLIGRPLLSVPHNVIDDNANISRLQRFQRVEALKQHFWRRFSNEYVCSLQQRSKWRSSRGQLQEGDLVLLKDASQPPLLWLMGRVTAIEPSSDGLARIVQSKFFNISNLSLRRYSPQSH